MNKEDSGMKWFLEVFIITFIYKAVDKKEHI
jgi:hypothetical protein